MPTHSRILDLLPAYALGVIDPDETNAVEKHLAQCSICQAELRAYEAVTADLALAAPPVFPPPRLRQKILNAVAPPPPASPPAPWWRRWTDALRAPGHALAAASAALVILLLASNIILFGRMRSLERQMAAQSHHAMKTVLLTGSEILPQANAVLVLAEDNPGGVLVVDDLPTLDAAHAYQLWLITADGRRESGGVFNMNERGHAAVIVESPAPLQNYAAFGVTIEPAGGSPAPTGPNVLKGQNQSG